MTSVFTPYMARFTTGDNEYYVTLDRGITVVEAARDVYGELETELVERFKSTFFYRGALMVIKDYGFPGFMHDEEALAISLATLSVHKGRVKSVSQALKAFYPKFEKNERKLKIQFFGGMYDAKSFSRIQKPIRNLRVIAKKSGSVVTFILVTRENLLSKVCEIVSVTSADNVRVYTPLDKGTQVFATPEPS